MVDDKLSLVRSHIRNYSAPGMLKDYKKSEKVLGLKVGYRKWGIFKRAGFEC